MTSAEEAANRRNSGHDYFDHDQSFEDNEHGAKRRKLRKGTRSCWECKRRKVRCTFANESDTICIACRRRGGHCLSQEFPEELVQSDNGQVNLADRVGRVEALLEQLVMKVGGTTAVTRSEGGNSVAGILTPTPTVTSDVPQFPQAPEASPLDLEPRHAMMSTESSFRLMEAQRYLKQSTGIIGTTNGKLRKISEALVAAWPSPADLQILCGYQYNQLSHAAKIYFEPYEVLEREGIELPLPSPDPPTPDTHPVILARRMLLFALFLQGLPQIPGLSEDVRAMQERMAEEAINLVSTNENLHGSVESLHCIMLECAWQSNGGNLRRAWLAGRRALSLAQMIGINRPSHPAPKQLDPTTKVHTQHLWFRIVQNDRTWCLILGLPPGADDRSFTSEAAMSRDTDIGRFERLLSNVTARILERNEKGITPDDFAITQGIDADLLNAAKGLRPDFWDPPKFDDVLKYNGYDTARFINQLNHYTLINQLHLPYLLGFDQNNPEHGYSRLSCVCSSREILQRWIPFRKFKPVLSCCRPADFSALFASMTLSLAHLDSHRRPASMALFERQRSGDLRLLREVLETMDNVARLNNQDTLATKSADLLRRLLYIEADAARGRAYSTQNMKDAPTDGEAMDDRCEGDKCSILHISVPYFGIVKIAREGVSKESDAADLMPRGLQTPTPKVSTPSTSTGQREILPSMAVPPFYSANVQPHPMFPWGNATSGAEGDASTQGVADMSFSGLDDPFFDPSIAAGIEDWAFQGVDTAFFDSLMRSQGSFEVDSFQ